jgi:hypothetical protein
MALRERLARLHGNHRNYVVKVLVELEFAHGRIVQCPIDAVMECVRVAA